MIWSSFRDAPIKKNKKNTSESKKNFFLWKIGFFCISYITTKQNTAELELLFSAQKIHSETQEITTSITSECEVLFFISAKK